MLDGMPTRTEKKAGTRARLLAAARKVFAAKGYAGAAVDDVALEAGLTKGAVYAHFRTKEALFLALLRERGLETLGELRAAIEGKHEPRERDAFFAEHFKRGITAREGI